jgi:hypothetical protein
MGVFAYNVSFGEFYDEIGILSDLKMMFSILFLVIKYERKKKRKKRKSYFKWRFSRKTSFSNTVWL